VLLLLACGGSDLTNPKAETLARASELFDSELNLQDTYLIMDVQVTGETTITSDEPFVDPATEQEVTTLILPGVNEQAHIEGGYSYYGDTRLSQYWTGDEEFAGEIASTRIINDVVQYFDANGQFVDVPEAQELIQTTGSLINSVTPDGVASACPESRPGCETTLQMSINFDPDARGLASKDSAKVGERVFEETAEELKVTTPFTDGRRSGRVQNKYRKENGKWVLAESDRVSSERADGLTTDEHVLTHFTNVRWNVNSAKDKARRSRKPAKSAFSSYSAAARSVMTADARRGPNPGQLNPPGALRKDISREYGGSQSIVFQHGIFSGSDTWTRMEGWLAPLFSVGHELIPDLPSTDGLDKQADSLRTKIGGLGDNIIFIAHSQGGLVSRRVGQYNASLYSPVGGVITIGTPHLGVPITLISDVSARKILNAAAGRIYCAIRAGCQVVLQIAQTVVSQFDTFSFLNTNNDASRDLKPRSGFIGALNSRTENFKRAGIVDIADGRWKWIRLIGDSRTYPEAPGGGRELQKKMTHLYVSIRSCAHWTWFIPISPNCGDLQRALLAIDETYERFVSPGQWSDGLVPQPSQNYPNTPSPTGAPLFYFIRYGDSHVGETRSDLVRDKLKFFALPAFGVPVR